MKKINVFVILASLLISFSCQSSSDLELATTSSFDSKNPLSAPSAFERTSDEVQKLALDVATMIKPTNGLRGLRNLSVSSVYALKDKNELRSLSTSDANLHVVEFSNNEGYALVSGNRNDAGVLYVSDKGKFDKDFYERNLAPHIRGYMSGSGIRPYCSFGCPNAYVCGASNHPIPGYICEYRCRRIEDCPHQPKIDTPIRLPQEPIQVIPDSSFVRCELLRGKENLLKTNWPIWHPFNLFTPIVKWKDKNGVEHEGHAFIGCNAIAIMQIMAYHKSPQCLGADAMPWERFREMDDFEGDDQILIARAAKYVADEIKSMYGYASSRETAAYHSDVKDFLMRVGYKNYSSQQYDIEAVKNELDQNRPLFITASVKGANAGHIWIIDGYKEMKYTTLADTVIYNFVHCNWGWAKHENQGYCYSGVFYKKQQYQDVEKNKPVVDPIPHEGAYTEYCQIYTGIEPKR